MSGCKGRQNTKAVERDFPHWGEGDMKLHEAYLAKAAELKAKAKVTREMASKANFERMAGIYFRLAAKATRSNYSGYVIKHRKKMARIRIKAEALS
jgi:hypothetical protein